MFDEEAGVFDNGKASGEGFFGGSGIFDSLLEPQDFRFDGNGGICDRGDVFGAAEDVDDVNGNGYVFKAGVGCFAENFGFVGIDGNDFVAHGLEIRGNAKRRAQGVGREADDGDGFGVFEYVGYGIGCRD